MLLKIVLMTNWVLKAVQNIPTQNMMDCIDELPQCEDYVEKWGCNGDRLGQPILRDSLLGDSLDMAIDVLTHCRPSCAKLYQNQHDMLPPNVQMVGGLDILPPNVQMLGGVGGSVVDVFGFSVPVCSLTDGFDSVKRRRILEQTAKAKTRLTMVPAFTKEGFLRVNVPEDVNRLLMKVRDGKLSSQEQSKEMPTSGITNLLMFDDNNQLDECIMKTKNTTILMEIKEDDMSVIWEVLKKLTPRAEQWSGLKLQPTSVYGVRRYHRGAILHSHVDRMPSHVVSVIINLDQKVDHPWPLYILDHEGSQHQVILKPGEMVWYESARLVHARPQPFLGEYYDNVFVHFKPSSDNWYTEDEFLDWEVSRTVSKEMLVAE